MVSPSPGAPGVDATATRGGGTDRAASPQGRAAGPSNGGEGREGQGTASGAATALAVPGSGGAAGDYEGYYARLRARLKEVLRYPPVARRRGLEGTVHLDIDVEPSGAIGAVTVVSSSSHDVLDRAAVDAVRSMSRVPFPSDVRPRPLKVRLPVVFALP